MSRADLLRGAETQRLWYGISRLAIAAFLGSGAASAQVNVLTSNYDNARTNSNLQETILNNGNVNTSSFGKLGYFPVDGEIYAQPLYVSAVQIKGQGAHNVVYIATMHNSVYAIEADKPGSTAPLWQVNLGPSVASSVLNFNDILPEVGILSTPVIDLTRQILYVVSDTLEGGTPALRLHALSLADGHEMLNGPVVIAAEIKGNGAGSDGSGKLPFDPSIHLQRPGLALANGLLYLAFGSRGDLGNWHGWLMSYDASDLHQMSVITTSPNGYGGSIWQSGRAPAIDPLGNIYVVTGNGDFDGTVNFSESILKLSGTDLTLLDWYTPDIFNDLNAADADLGSSGAILVSANQVITGGKSGDIFLADRDSMGHLGPRNTSTVQNVQASQNPIHDTALWNNPSGPILYLQESAGRLKAYQIVNGKLNTALLTQAKPTAPTAFAGIAISGDIHSPSNAIVWQTNADYAKIQQPGTLHAHDASDLSHELWNSDMAPGDALGRFAKFVSPTVANGKVYVPTFSNELVIYGLFPSGMTPAELGGPQITAVTNNASFLAGAISPGELVAIFGANLGPQALTGAQVDNTGHLTTVLSHTKVFFDDVAAPLLYTSSNEVGAVAPFGIKGPTIQVQVQNGSEFSTPVTVPVVPATPALYSLNGTGGEVGAIINQDGSSNGFIDTAPRGSIVTMWATGAGQMNPGGNDGQIVRKAPYAAPVLPVTVFIDNQPAEVVYAGAAPNMVEGLIQINARVPPAASSGQVQIVVKIGGYSSPNSVTVVVQ